MNKPVISFEVGGNLEKDLYRQGFLTEERDREEVGIKTTVPCPICALGVILDVHGNSHTIKCETHGILVSARGI